MSGPSNALLPVRVLALPPDERIAPLVELLPAGTAAAIATPPDFDAPLHASEARHVERAVESRRREFAAGRACARRALRVLGWKPQPIPRAPDRAPVWPPGIVGSISHSGLCCCAVVGRRAELRGIGIDVEESIPLPANLAEAICRADELRGIDRLAPPGGVTWEKILFSAKESVYKCYRPLTGSFLDFRDVAIELRWEDPTKLEGTFEIEPRNPARPWPFAAGALRGRWRVSTGMILTVVHCLPVEEAVRRSEERRSVAHGGGGA